MSAVIICSKSTEVKEEDEITRVQKGKQWTKRDESRVHRVLSLFCLQTVQASLFDLNQF